MIRQSLEIKLGQKMVLTPQLQQSIHLLMLSRLDLVDEMIEEVQVNPLLEMLEPGETASPDGEEFSSDQGADADSFAQEEMDSWDVDAASTKGDADDQPSDPLSTWEHPMLEGLDAADSFRDEQLNREEPSSDYSYEKFLAGGTSLEEHVNWQLSFSDLSAREKELACYLSGNLNEDGYLQISEEEIPKGLLEGVSFERVLGALQECDPPGVGARNLRESFLIQARQLDLVDSLVWRILSECMDEFLSSQFKIIMKTLHVTETELDAAMAIIRRFETKPGRPFDQDTPTAIVPDVLFRDAGEGEIEVSLIEAGIPRVRIHPMYRSLLKNMRKDDDSRAYFEDKLKNAQWFLKSIEQRKKTILRVAEAILRYQRDFFFQGPSALKPLVLKTIAQDLGLHESTISRVTNKKYADTPFGLTELKFFFSGSIASSNGGDHSSVSVREKLREVVRREKPEHPLSDQEIMDQLAAEGVVIARRTVAKYRMELDIPPVNKRKKSTR
jgi:RNA polymerase sigma-54 factor